MWRPESVLPLSAVNYPSMYRSGIIRTLAFQAAWGFAPTRLQLAMFYDGGSSGQNGPSGPDGTAIHLELNQLIQEGLVIESEARLALKPFSTLIQKGREREFYFPRKLRRARKVAAWINRLPWVRAICLCNTTALGQARDEGDLDFFIIAKAGTIWRTRFFSTLPFKLLGARPGGRKSSVLLSTPAPLTMSCDLAASSPSNYPLEKGKGFSGSTDPVCLSFFVTDDALDLAKYMLPDNDRAELDDPYFRYWFLSMLPLVDDGVLMDLWIKNKKITQRHPLAKRWIALDSDDPFGGRQSVTLSRQSWIERLLKKFQEKQFPDAIKKLANQDSRVIISDQALKFHVEDRREEYRQKYYEICKQFGVEP